MTLSQVRVLFTVAGFYDFIIGLTFLLAGAQLFDWAGVPHPNHWAYVQFASLLLIIFGLMFLTISWDPVANRNLIPFGMLLKISYTGLVAYYWSTGECPLLFKPFAIIDGIMLVLFSGALIMRPKPALSN